MLSSGGPVATDTSLASPDNVVAISINSVKGKMTESPLSGQIKIAALVRRKPHMTAQEFRDYHFQIHGKLSDEPTDVQLKPACGGLRPRSQDCS